MVSRPTSELLWHVLSRLTPESRSFFLHSLGARQRLSRVSKPSSGARQQREDQEEGKILAWRRPQTTYAQLTPELLAEIRQHAAAFEAERLAAPGLANELLALPPEQRDEAVDEEKRFQTLAVAEQLLGRSRELCFHRSQQGREVAELSLEIVQRLETDHYGSQVVQDLCGRAWSEIANACRLSSDLAGAERALLKAEACVLNSSDPLEKARLCNLKAALKKDQRRFEEASRLRDRAIAIYTRFRDQHSVGRTLNSKGSDFLELGRPEKAMECLQAAVELLDPTVEPRIAVAAIHNLTLALAEQGRFEEAAEALARSQDLYTNADRDIQTKGEWVRGRIAAGLGRLDEAERAFKAARKDYQDREMAFDFALVSLDLAVTYARRRKTSEVKRLAREMMPIFESRHIPRETLAALSLFRQAVEQETVTVEFLHKIIARLEGAPCTA